MFSNGHISMAAEMVVQCIRNTLPTWGTIDRAPTLIRPAR
jgi:hypothetical protein